MLNHPRRRIVGALSVLAMCLAMAFIPTLFAQRVAPKRQQGETLKTLTLSGKGGARRLPTPRTGTRPRSLTPAQKVELFRGRTPKQHFTLTPDKPIFSDKAGLFYEGANLFASQEKPGYYEVEFEEETGCSYQRLGFYFHATAGKLYALDFSVYTQGEATYTVENRWTEATQTTPVEHGTTHITAYVTAEDDYLTYYLSCSSEWSFFSLEVTEL